MDLFGGLHGRGSFPPSGSVACKWLHSNVLTFPSIKDICIYKCFPHFTTNTHISLSYTIVVCTNINLL